MQRFALIAILLLAFHGAVYAEEKFNPFRTDNSISIKAGTVYAKDSDFTEFWSSENDSTDIVVSYERKLGGIFGLELAGGYSYSADSNTGVLTIDDEFSVKLRSYYASLSGIIHLPSINRLGFYIGGGPDYYYTDAELSYKHPTLTLSKSDTFDSYGAHAIAGAEVIILKYPGLINEYSAPVGLFIEYRYSWVLLNDADEALITQINNTFGTSFKNHDLNIGGHGVFAGLRWHF